MTVEEPKPTVQTSAEEERVVIDRVLDQLGTPNNLFRTVAKKVSKNQYRVNIYCMEDPRRPVRTVSITDSFFVTLSGADMEFKPTIRRKY
jgi:hypothetical protein